VDRATGQRQSTPRWQRTPAPLAASVPIVNAIVIDGRTLWLAVPDSNRTGGPWLEHNLADCFADQLRDAASRPRGGFAQGIELFLAEVNLDLFARSRAIDIRQVWGVPAPKLGDFKDGVVLRQSDPMASILSIRPRAGPVAFFPAAREKRTFQRFGCPIRVSFTPFPWCRYKSSFRPSAIASQRCGLNHLDLALRTKAISRMNLGEKVVTPNARRLAVAKRTVGPMLLVTWYPALALGTATAPNVEDTVLLRGENYAG
jgi:hypothetical protein